MCITPLRDNSGKREHCLPGAMTGIMRPEMGISSIQRLLTGRSDVDLLLWGAVFLSILTAIVWVLRYEKRRFQSLGKGRSWLWLRLLYLPFAALTALVVVVPARLVSGPEALAVFYIGLLTVGPLSWFGLHWLAGVLVSPRLTRAESNGIALIGLGIVIGPLLVINGLQGPVFIASHQLNERMMARAERVPLGHAAQPLQRFRLGDAGEIFTQSLNAPAGLRVERVDAAAGGEWFDTRNSMHPTFCRQGDDLHLVWPVGARPPALRIYWHDERGGRRQAEFRADVSKADSLPAQAFQIGWRIDGIDLPAPLSRYSIQLAWPPQAGRLYYRTLDNLQAGENFEENCMMPGYRRVAWRDEGPIAGLILRFHPPAPAQAWQYEALRPSPSTSEGGPGR